MAPTTNLRKRVANRLWKAGLAPHSSADSAYAFALHEYPTWRIRCFQTRRWLLWTLFEQALVESADPEAFLTLITVDRRDGSEAATFPLELLEAWLAGQTPRVAPRRKARVGFAHHRLLQRPKTGVPVLFSAQERKPILMSIPLKTFKQWLHQFPAPRHPQEKEGTQLAFPLWHMEGEKDEADGET